MKQVYAVEGLDRLGKSTLIQGIMNKLGFYQAVHFSKPQRLDAYAGSVAEGFDGAPVPANSAPLYHYQLECFRNSMLMASSGARLIFDRWHLGEAVYSPLYRGFSGDYVFDLEKTFNLDDRHSIRLILLVEDFSVSQHFQDDGLSLGSVKNRQKEQGLFVSAFSRSIIRDKRIICVTDPGTGKFRPKEWVLDKAIG